PQWQLPIEFRRRMGNIAMICDPSHIGGKRELVLSLSQQALDLNFDGLMIETHCNPVCALSDARQQVTPDELEIIMSKLVRRSAESDNVDFQSYRNRLDEIDNKLMELLVRRMAVAREIGAVKREKGLTVFQPFRYNKTIERYTKYCKDGKIDIEAVKSIFEAVHSESIRQQLRVVNEGNE
ncbi:MAG: bifunctional 3-deoxy-7-phosphoheptulonate synthase/chorismate mutase type II, partial [Bacteroidaceae bacterium]|nr:bifunctional 3-deoxy-7-phosphoheptulonate synthase/chorismate mutase type II [Bacteroidaceae bacterium]